MLPISTSIPLSCAAWSAVATEFCRRGDVLQVALVLMAVEAYLRPGEAPGLTDSKELAGPTGHGVMDALGDMAGPWKPARAIENWSRRRHLRSGLWTDAVGVSRLRRGGKNTQQCVQLIDCTYPSRQAQSRLWFSFWVLQKACGPSSTSASVGVGSATSPCGDARKWDGRARAGVY